eukprot:9864461-Alexandrium_andersonii.AAC.1
MQVEPDAAGSPPGQPAAPSPLAPQGSEPRAVPEAATKEAVAGLVDMQLQAQRMRTPSPASARERAARESIDRALS